MEGKEYGYYKCPCGIGYVSDVPYIQAKCPQSNGLNIR